VPLVWLIITGGVLLALWFASEPWRRRRRHQRRAARPVPAHWQRLIERHLPLYRHMPAPERERMHAHMQVFLAEKRFYGCNGLDVTEAMRVAVAAHAALLVLRRTDAPYADLDAVLLYPEAFVVRHARVDAAGVVDDSERVLIGESWSLGRIVLSWADMLEAARRPEAGRNVALHEFAHQLDAEDGAEGAPALPDARAYRAWSQALGAAFRRLRARLAHGGASGVIDPYGATAPAEFFAVAVEAFFQVPVALREHEPELYAALRGYFQLDPATWLS